MPKLKTELVPEYCSFRKQRDKYAVTIWHCDTGTICVTACAPFGECLTAELSKSEVQLLIYDLQSALESIDTIKGKTND